MHVYLEASSRLELLIARGMSYVKAMAVVAERFGLTQGERELMRWAYLERRKDGTVRPVRVPNEPT